MEMEIRVSDIEICSRKRGINTDKVSELVLSIGEIGLLQPIAVVRANGNYRLVAGMHRIEAFKVLGRETIPAVVVNLDELDAELGEIDENLMRVDLTVLEQGELLLRRDEILKEKGQRAKAGDNQFIQGGETVSLPQRKSTSDVAAEIGISERSTQQRIQIARDILPEVKEAIKDTEIADSTRRLLEIARLDEKKQRDILKHKDVEMGVLIEVSNNDMSERRKTIALLHTGDYESYTPTNYIEAAREVMGSIDTDPASNEMAQYIVKAKTYYTLEDDGLTKEWEGNIFLNPPYSQPEIKEFIDKLLSELTPGKQAILLTNNNTDTNWFYDAAKRANAVCFTKGRINFYKANGDITSPTNGQAFFYFGNNEEKFIKIFNKFGLVMKVIYDKIPQDI